MQILILGQTDEQLLGTTQVIIDPQLQGRIQDAVNDIRQSNPAILKDITHIYALHSGNFGEWHSDDPHAIFLNINHIEQEVKRQLQQGLSPEEVQSDIVKQEIEKAIREQTGKVIVHEHAHVEAPEKGEPFAEERERGYSLQTAGLRSFTSGMSKKRLNRFAARERQHFTNILGKLGYSIEDNGKVLYSRDPIEKEFESVWEAIDHEKQVIANNKRLVEAHKETADPKLIETKQALIKLATERLRALEIWNKTYGQNYPLPGYIISDLGEGQYLVTKVADDTKYTVDAITRTCTCPAGKQQRQCKHLKAVLWKTA